MSIYGRGRASKADEAIAYWRKRAEDAEAKLAALKPKTEIVHEWGCVENPSYGGSCIPCNCAKLEINLIKTQPVFLLWVRFRDWFWSL